MRLDTIDSTLKGQVDILEQRLPQDETSGDIDAAAISGIIDRQDISTKWCTDG